MIYSSNYAVRKLQEIRGFYPSGSVEYCRLTSMIRQLIQEDINGSSIIVKISEEIHLEDTGQKGRFSVKLLPGESVCTYDQGVGAEASKSDRLIDG